LSKVSKEKKRQKAEGKSEEQRAECGECALSYKTGRVALQPCFSIR